MAASTTVDKDKFDSLVFVGPDVPTSGPVKTALQKLLCVDEALNKEGCVTSCDEVPGKRLIYSPTGPLSGDYDDVRLYGEAGKKGIKR